MSSQVYNVPIIPPELRQEEFILQIADSLEYLEQITEDVFKRITNRVHETQDKLKLINERTARAQAKIDMLKGSKKAIRVFAGAKYPADNTLETYKSIFDCESELKNIKRVQHDIESKYRSINENTYKEKLQFYSVNIKQKKDNNQNEEGLGKLPKTINSVSSLLLYNTGENPYNKYVIMDPLSGAITKSRANIAEEKEQLGDAPSSIVKREENERGTADNYFYMPGLGNVPEIDVPVYLPDLPGVVDDEIYSGDVGESIAPSLLANLPDLPPVESDYEGIIGDSVDMILPPQPSEVLPVLLTDATGNVPAPPQQLPPPPAPPSPPPADDMIAIKNKMQAVESEENGKDIGQATASFVPSIDDGRAGLMDAIRKAGGAEKVGLKSTKDRKMKRKKEKEGSVSSAVEEGGGDLMSDLFNKLSMRRKGISGTKSQTNEKSNENLSPMDKISAMIPPPEKPGRSQSHDSGDWE